MPRGPRTAGPATCFCCVTILSLLACKTALAAFEVKNNKIIEWGWDTSAAAPNGYPYAPPALPGNVPTYEQNLAFDGVGISLRQNPPLSDSTQDLFGFKAFGSTTLNSSNYSQSISALQSSPFVKFNANSVVLEVTPGNVDWYDNSGFNAINANAQTAAGVAATIPGTTAILLDVEDYAGQLFYYNGFSAGQKSAHTYQQYQSQVRTRGSQFMNTLRTAMPNVQVLLTMGYERASGAGAADENGLLPSFIDGLLDGAGPNNTVYDGYEYAYPFRQSSLFETAYNDMRSGQASITGNVSAYNAHYRASYGLWVDYNSSSLGWSSSNPSTNYFTPDKFRFVLQQSAMRSDGFVWVYSQQPSWYAPQVSWSLSAGPIPQAYKDALAAVKRKGLLERFSGTVKDTATWTQHTESSATVAQNDKLTITAAGSGEADFTTSLVTVGIGDVFSVEVTPSASTSAVLGVALTNDSGGSASNIFGDTRSLFIRWSDANNAIYAGVSDSSGLNSLQVLYAGDEPLGTTFVYQIERTSLTTAEFSIWNATTGARVSNPLVRNFSGMPTLLNPAVFTQSGTASFDELWIGQVPEPALGCLAAVAIYTMTSRRRIVSESYNSRICRTDTSAKRSRA